MSFEIQKLPIESNSTESHSLASTNRTTCSTLTDYMDEIIEGKEILPLEFEID